MWQIGLFLQINQNVSLPFCPLSILESLQDLNFRLGIQTLATNQKWTLTSFQAKLSYAIGQNFRKKDLEL